MSRKPDLVTVIVAAFIVLAGWVGIVWGQETPTGVKNHQ
jgi:hypothetical protein